jgi:hypothetical protein
MFPDLSPFCDTSSPFFLTAIFDDKLIIIWDEMSVPFYPNPTINNLLHSVIFLFRFFFILLPSCIIDFHKSCWPFARYHDNL